MNACKLVGLLLLLLWGHTTLYAQQVRTVRGRVQTVEAGSNEKRALPSASIWDEEFRKRVERHQKNRGPEWTNIEEEKELSRHNVAGRVVVIDCVTLWCTNFFMEFDSNVASSLEAVKKEFDKFTQQDATFIFVTNEIGWGGSFREQTAT